MERSVAVFGLRVEFVLNGGNEHNKNATIIAARRQAQKRQTGFLTRPVLGIYLGKYEWKRNRSRIATSHGSGSPSDGRFQTSRTFDDCMTIA
ncbi:unnamed protein product [Dimorphilus gyrociliatus]|uniref:Uncharacterized protein n=1 Tax=Dimorphilus gyrociliatus TaxID=2664684 RepID=A0A7I8W3X2_9ANNE|nr:unnamed protein product [Dimorphilus gyrociliatus]